MKYCPNCGKEVDSNIQYCPNCGNELNAQKNNQETPKSNGNKPTVTERNIATAIILSIVTCGIYGIVWYINLVDDVNKVCQDEQSNQSGGIVFLLTLVTFGIYGIIWFYQAGKRMFDAGKKYGVEIADNTTIYLVLAIFGLQIVDYCLVQSDLNKFAK